MKRARGFTLIEVLIAMAILGILMAVAIPSYGDYVMRGRRAEGRTALNEALQAQERFYAANQRYSAFSPATPNGFATTSGDSPAAASYVLSAAACPGAAEAACVVISATPRAADPQCGTLTLSTNGVRAPAQCWTR